ncbi:MAG TPA: hypothetical protein VEW28_08735 [Candidatus Kapabacteria bacterium]|nr:hypothetical protein [Candidatus Kapabacteria bacterium]
MTSLTTEKFWKAFNELPDAVQEQAQKNYGLWRNDPFHPSLDFKKIHPKRPIFSVRIGMHWRAIGIKDDETIVWFWIGSHADYDKLIDEL